MGESTIMKYLANRKILFIAPAFYDYHLKIIESIKDAGGEVDFFRERPDTLGWRYAKKLSKKIQKKIESHYLNTILEEISNRQYDYFFLIRGEIFTPCFLKKLKELFPATKFIMYQWDSDRVVDYIKNIEFFDKVLTFDMKDAQKHHLSYLPLFFTKAYSQKRLDIQKKYDIVFVGYYHTDRLAVIQKIEKECVERGLNFKYYIHLKFLVMLKFILLGKLLIKNIKYINTKPIDTEAIAMLYAKSIAALDIENYDQDGLTMRSLEVLGSNTKLITTNSNIRNEIFFDIENIMIIDRNRPEIDHGFFDTGFKSNTEIEKLSISNWVKNIFYMDANVF